MLYCIGVIINSLQELWELLLREYPDKFCVNDPEASGMKLKGGIVTQPVDRFIDRQEAMSRIFQFSSFIFEHGVVASQNRIPMATVYGAPGSGKTELFLQLMDHYDYWYNVAATSSAGSFFFGKRINVPQQTHPDICMPLAVTLNNQMNICPIEIEEGFDLITMLGCRLFFLWFTNFDNYLEFLTFLEEFLECSMTNVKMLMDFGEVVEMICRQHGKSQCIVTIDETIKFHEKLRPHKEDYSRLINNITSMVNNQSKASSNNVSIAIIFSSSCISPYEGEQTSSNRSWVRIYMPMLNAEHVTEMSSQTIS